MIIFMFGIVLTIVLFIAMGFVRGEGMSWRVNKKQLLALVGVLVIVFSCYVSIPAGHTGVATTLGSVKKTSPGPEAGEMPNEKTAGKMASPERTAAVMSDSETIAPMRNIFSFLRR